MCVYDEVSVILDSSILLGGWYQEIYNVKI